MPSAVFANGIFLFHAVIAQTATHINGRPVEI
jgi:hypothetical protein